MIIPLKFIQYWINWHRSPFFFCAIQMMSFIVQSYLTLCNSLRYLMIAMFCIVSRIIIVSCIPCIVSLILYSIICNTCFYYYNRELIICILSYSFGYYSMFMNILIILFLMISYYFISSCYMLNISLLNIDICSNVNVQLQFEYKLDLLNFILSSIILSKGSIICTLLSNNSNFILSSSFINHDVLLISYFTYFKNFILSSLMLYSMRLYFILFGIFNIGLNFILSSFNSCVSSLYNELLILYMIFTFRINDIRLFFILSFSFNYRNMISYNLKSENFILSYLNSMNMNISNIVYLQLLIILNYRLRLYSLILIYYNYRIYCSCVISIIFYSIYNNYIILFPLIVLFFMISYYYSIFMNHCLLNFILSCMISSLIICNVSCIVSSNIHVVYCINILHYSIYMLCFIYNISLIGYFILSYSNCLWIRIMDICISLVIHCSFTKLIIIIYSYSIILDVLFLYSLIFNPMISYGIIIMLVIHIYNYSYEFFILSSSFMIYSIFYRLYNISICRLYNLYYNAYTISYVYNSNINICSILINMYELRFMFRLLNFIYIIYYYLLESIICFYETLIYFIYSYYVICIVYYYSYLNVYYNYDCMFVPNINFNVNHKILGILYIISGFIFSICGIICSLIIRNELYADGIRLLSNSSNSMYNVYFTIHGLIMIFYLIMPILFGGYGNYFYPIYLPAPEVAFSRINFYSIILLILSFVLFINNILSEYGVSTGWTMYPPLSTSLMNLSPLALDYIILGLIISGISSIMSSINYIASLLYIINYYFYPLFMYCIIFTSLLLIICLPILTAVLILLMLDLNINTCYFDPLLSGDPIFYQHLFWIFGHPEVYVLILPAFGFINTIINELSIKPIFSYYSMMIAIICIFIIGLIVWGHHMYTVGLYIDTKAYFVNLTIIISLPTGTKIFNWLSSILYNNILIYNVSYLYLCIFIIVFTLGGTTGIILGNSAIDISLHDTYYVIAHFHLVLSLGALITIFAYLYLILSILFNDYNIIYNSNSILSKLYALLILKGILLTFIPLHFLGFNYIPRRIPDFNQNTYAFNMLSSLGSNITTISLLILKH
jgi:heme/copper-type cytochrome/quinol oxidase subunit 1